MTPGAGPVYNPETLQTGGRAHHAATRMDTDGQESGSGSRAGTEEDASASAELRVVRAELARSEQRLRLFREIAGALDSFHSRPDELITHMVGRIAAALRAERGTLYLLDPDGQGLTSRYVSGERTDVIRVRLGEGIAGWVAEHGTSVNVKDAYLDPRFVARFDEASGFVTRSLLCHPLRGQSGTVIGVIQLLNAEDGYFSVEDQSLLGGVAGVTASVIEAHRMYLEVIDQRFAIEDMKRRLDLRLKEQDLLYRVQRIVQNPSDVDSMVSAVARELAVALRPGACLVSISEGGRVRTRVHLGRAGRAGDFLIEHAGESEVARWTQDAGDGRAIEEVARVPVARLVTPMTDGVRDVVSVPILTGSGCAGHLTFVNRYPVGRTAAVFAASEPQLLMVVAGQLASAIDAAREAQQRMDAERMSAIGSMLSGLMHDLKTPLTIVSGYIQLMARSGDATVREDYARRAISQFHALNEMTREVLSYARGQSVFLARHVSIGMYASELSEQLLHEFEGHPIALSVETPYRGDARFDDGKMKRVLFNLARNAREAMPGGGHFTVRFERLERDLVVLCEDDGPGLPEEVRARVFQAFVTSGKRGGTGLGLAIVKKLVEEHGGTIEVDSATGRGTRFRIRLPNAIEGPPSST